MIMLTLVSFGQIKNDSTKSCNGEPMPDSLKVAYLMTEGAIISQPDLGISFFEGHETDSIGGILNCGNFRSALMVHGARSILIVRAPRGFTWNGGPVHVEHSSKIDEAIIEYREGNDYLSFTIPIESEILTENPEK